MQNKNNAYHSVIYLDFSTLSKSCQEKGKCYSSSVHGYDRFFCFLKIRLEEYFLLEVTQSKPVLKHSNRINSNG